MEKILDLIDSKPWSLPFVNLQDGNGKEKKKKIETMLRDIFVWLYLGIFSFDNARKVFFFHCRQNYHKLLLNDP